jgi:hypothetical protein
MKQDMNKAQGANQNGFEDFHSFFFNTYADSLNFSKVFSMEGSVCPTHGANPTRRIQVGHKWVTSGSSPTVPCTLNRNNAINIVVK